MKKIITALVLIMIFCAVPAYAHENVTITTNFKETVIENGLYIADERVYMPIESACAAVGAAVYKSGDGGEYYIISRDGDVMVCRAGCDYYELNGRQINTSSRFIYTDAGEMLAPFSMFAETFAFNVVYDDKGAHIIRNLSTNIYNEYVKDVMRFCFGEHFYPENFSRYLKYHVQNPGMYMGTVIDSVNIDLDKVWHNDAAAAENSGSRTVLVNKTHKLAENYEPENLVRIYAHYTKNPKRPFYMNEEAYYKYVDMYDAAARENLYLKIISAYRTETYQKNLYNSYVNGYGAQYAENYSARPGYSEHQTGLAVDINSLYTSFENSNEYKWLKDNAHKFGFIERYKKGCEHITGYAYEPWHYRYVGVEAAQTIYERNLTFEEYCSDYLNKSAYTTDNDKLWAEVARYYY